MNNENKPIKKHKKSYKGFVFIIFIATILAVVCYDHFFGKDDIKKMVEALIQTNKTETVSKENNENKEDKKEKEKEKEIVSVETDTKSIFKVYEKGFVQCTKDGAKFYNLSGIQKWNDTYTITSPVVVKEGEYMAIAEYLGRNIRVYNENGFIYQINAENPIISFSINQNGYLVTIVGNKIGYRIQVYDNKGAAGYLDRKDEIDNVFPVSADISDDNRVLAVSYLDTSDIEIKSRILFFYINKDEGKEYQDAMFASSSDMSGKIIPMLRCMEGNIFVAVSDSDITGFSIDAKEMWKYESNNKFDNINTDGKRFVVVANGDMFPGKDGKELGTVEWINMSGKSTAVFDVKEKITYLNSNKNYVVVGVSKNFYCLNNSGKVLWEHTAIQDIDDILLINGSEQVLYVTRNKAEVIKISDYKYSLSNTDTNKGTDENNNIPAEEPIKENKDEQNEENTNIQ